MNIQQERASDLRSRLDGAFAAIDDALSGGPPALETLGAGIVESALRVVHVADEASLITVVDRVPGCIAATGPEALEISTRHVARGAEPIASLLTGKGSADGVAVVTGTGPFRSIMAAAVTGGDERLGAVAWLKRDAGGFDPAAVEAARLFTAAVSPSIATAVALAGHAARVDQLEEAVDSRDLIAQAKGILMAREACSAEEAFDILRAASQHANKKLRDIAREVVRRAQERSA